MYEHVFKVQQAQMPNHKYKEAKGPREANKKSTLTIFNKIKAAEMDLYMLGESFVDHLGYQEVSQDMVAWRHHGGTRVEGLGLKPWTWAIQIGSHVHDVPFSHQQPARHEFHIIDK